MVHEKTLAKKAQTLFWFPVKYYYLDVDNPFKIFSFSCLVFYYIAAGKSFWKAGQCRREGAAGGQPAPAGHRWEDRVHQGIYCHAQIYYVDNVPQWFLTWLVNWYIIDYVLLQSDKKVFCKYVHR